MIQKKKPFVAAMTVCAIVFILCACYITHYFMRSQQNERDYTALSQTLRALEENLVASSAVPTDPRVLALRELQAQSPSLVGWIRIADTPINYPVMQTPDEPEYYLNRDFEGTRSVYGTPFLNPYCDITKPSDNMIVYAHRMKDGSMFGSLGEYKDADYCKAHPSIRFDTLEDAGDYAVLAVFQSSVSGSDFAYYQFVNAADEEAFNAFVASAKAHAMYDTGVSAAYGDHLLTLATCEGSRKNDRLVVIARKAA